MKKYLVPFVVICSTHFSVTAQDFIDFGKPTLEELTLIACTFEEDAEAVVLLHDAYSYSETDQSLITTHHIRLKILNPKGFNQANIKIPFYAKNKFEKITGLEAYTINLTADGKIFKQKVASKTIYTTKINERFGEVSFAFPSVKVGSILEYQYKSTMKYYWGLRDWFFQQNIPVVTSRYNVKLISTKKFSYKIFKDDSALLTVIPEQNRIFFQMKNIKSLPNEPFMDAKKDYLQRVEFLVQNYYTARDKSQIDEFGLKWNELNTFFLSSEYLGAQIFKPITGVELFIDSVNKITDAYKKMHTIHNYVKKTITWNNINDFFCLDVDIIWSKKIGTSGDINLILVNLLNKAHLSANPFLVSLRKNGNIDTAYANPEQFNSLMVCARVNNKLYILDATEKYNEPFEIPEGILNSTGFVLNAFEGELLKLVADTTLYKQEVLITMNIDSNCTVLNGNTEIKNFNYAKIEYLKKYKEDSSLLRKDYLNQKNIQLQNIDLTYNNEVLETEPTIEKIKFSAIPLGTGAYKYIPLAIFTAIDNNPFIAEKRVSAINFGYNKNFKISGKIRINNNYLPEGLPIAISYFSADSSIVFEKKINYFTPTNQINFEIEVKFLKNYYLASEYPTLKNAYKIIADKLSEPLILKRKN